MAAYLASLTPEKQTVIEEEGDRDVDAEGVPRVLQARERTRLGRGTSAVRRAMN